MLSICLTVFCVNFSVGSISTPFRYWLNNYKACYLKFSSSSPVSQIEFFRHFSEEGHYRFLHDIHVKIIDKLYRSDRI